MVQPASSSSSYPPAISANDMGESPPTRSVRGRAVSNMSQADVSIATDSIDTASSPQKFVPFFSISRFLKGSNDNNFVAPMSEPSSSGGVDDDNRSEVPSLSSLEAGTYAYENVLEPAPEPPMTLQEKARFFFRDSYPTHFDPPSCHDDNDDKTDVECLSNSSRSERSEEEHRTRLPPRRQSSHAILDPSNILFPNVSRLRDEHSMTTYMFSVFVGCVALFVLVIFLLVVNLK